MSHEIVPVENWHIEYVAANMREDDKREIWAQSLSRPEDGLRQAVQMSPRSYTALVNDEPVLIFGVGALSMLSGKGSPWMLGTDAINLIPYKFLKETKSGIIELLKDFDYLENVIDARNDVSIKWLKWLGFDILEAEPYGPFQVPFHVFKMEGVNPCAYH